jgi:hypothetical protein
MIDVSEPEWALLLVWVIFMTVVGVYVIRIALMLHEQRAIERNYRVRLAIHRGREARAQAEAVGSERATRST